MVEEYSIPLSKVIKELGLRELHLPKSADEIFIRSRDVNRPGLELNGFCDYFDPARITILGRSEMAMLNAWGEERKAQAVESFFSLRPPTVIVARGIQPCPTMLEAAERYDIPLLSSQDSTSSLVAGLVSYLNVELAPRVTRHGVLVEVYGEGVLLLGESGVGKSETAIELVKRGHRLVADDAVEIKRVGVNRLVGSAPELIRHYIELRGIGVVDVQQLFGMSAVREDQDIDLVVSLEQWNDETMYDRLGLEELYTVILDVKVPSLTVPVKPGRNLAIIVEVAAMNNRHKKMGYNAAQAFTQQINEHFDQAMSAQLGGE